MYNTRGARRAGSRLLAGVAALAVGMTGLLTATAAQAAPQQVTDLQLDWAYSSYAQYGVFGPWAIEAEGDGVTVNTVAETEVVGAVPGTSATPYRVASLSGGSGSLDPATGAGTITWPADGALIVNPVRMLGAPDLRFTAPTLEIAADGTGTLSFDIATGAGSDMSGNPVPAQPAQRITVMEFTGAGIVDGELTATPVYEGVHYFDSTGTRKTIDAGGSWPQAYIDGLPEAVRAFHYKTGTSGLNQQKAPLPFQVSGDLPEAPVIEGQPKIELFRADGVTPLGDTVVNAGDRIVVKGTGFDPDANNPGGDGSGLPIPNNQPQGTFVAFGAVADPWKPSAGGVSENRAQVRSNTQWVLLESVVNGLAQPLQQTIRNQAIFLDPATGTFEGEIVAATPAEIPQGAKFGVYTYAGGAVDAANAAQELFVPVTYGDAPTPNEDGGDTVLADGELVWGFKGSWREYVAGVAQGATHHSGHASIDEEGLFHFPLGEGSTYDPKTGEGVLHYEGRVRFQSSSHGFDIVLQNPHVTLTDGGDTGVLSAELSNTATVGDLSVNRVDVASIDVDGPMIALPNSGTSATGAAADGLETLDAAATTLVTYYSWNDQATTILDTIQPVELNNFYAGQAGDPVWFAYEVRSTSGNGGNTGTNGGGAVSGGSGETTGLVKAGADGATGLLLLAALLIAGAATLVVVRRRVERPLDAERVAGSSE